MNTITGNKAVLYAFTVIATLVVAGSVFLVNQGKMMEGSFESLVILILSVFGATAVVQHTGNVIQQTNGAKETTTTTIPPQPSSGVTVTTVKETAS